MTTIRDIPEEVLRMIFQKLSCEDVLHCQTVCRSWYMPAHIAALEQVTLPTVNHAEQFVASIDYNPDPLYLNAIKRIVLLATPGIPFDTLLDRYAHTFPGMKRLYLNYFCGTWSETSSESRVTLSQYSLERLGLDITPVEIQMKELGITERFFVIEVALLKHSERYLYELTFNIEHDDEYDYPFSYLSVTKIEDRDLKSFTRGKNYCWVHISIGNLKQLEIYWHPDPNDIYENERRNATYNAS